MASRIRIWVVLVLFALSGAAQAQVSGFESWCTTARTELVDGLRDHAKWCRTQKLFLSRQMALECLLNFEPDDAAARRTLGFKRKKGSWIAPRKPKVLHDVNAEASDEQAERMSGLLTPYVDRLHEYLANPKLADRQRSVAMEAILLADPDNESLHAMLGEVKVGDGWILRESSVSKGRRDTLESAARKAMGSDDGIEKVALTDAEIAIGLTWQTTAYGSPDARVIGTVTDGELARMARAVGAARGTFETMFGRVSLPDGFTVVLLSGPEQRERFLDGTPTLASPERARLLATDGGWMLGANSVAYWTPEEPYRLDGALRMVNSFFLGRALGVSLEHHWVHEGFGLYLTELLTGTRLTWYVRPNDSVASDSLQAIMLGSSEWKELAVESLGKRNSPRLADLVTKQGKDYRTIDLLYSYIIAAYFCEAWPEETPRMLKRIGAGEPATDVIPDVIGLGCDEIDARVLRWLGR